MYYHSVVLGTWNFCILFALDIYGILPDASHGSNEKCSTFVRIFLIVTLQCVISASCLHPSYVCIKRN